MTGIADVIRRAHQSAWHIVVTLGVLTLLDGLLYLVLPRRLAIWLVPHLFPGWHADLKVASMKQRYCPRPRIPDQRPTPSLMRKASSNNIGGHFTDGNVLSRKSGALHHQKRQHPGKIPSSTPTRWGILLPITSRSSPSDDEPNIWSRLEVNARRLVTSVPPSHRELTTIYVAIDQRDPILDNEMARARIRKLLSRLEVDICVSLPPAYQGAICWIWAKLAARAVDKGADFVVLLGDDVLIHHNEDDDVLCWQEDVEASFRDIAIETGLPFGCGCVAIRDEAFETFPTVPVIHRLHFEVFKGELFPPEFRNQHGDPFLFEIYRRWGASRYTKAAKLKNTIGGAAQPRYNKDTQQDKWRGDVLSRAIQGLQDWLYLRAPEAASSARIPCLDVVVPTYRCDETALKVLTSLVCERPVALHTTLVVDRPDAENLDAIRKLASQMPNRTVRVCVLEENSGASWARNVGLWQSFGDHAVLLDDDVIPEEGLIEAYLGALEREPGAAAYVGLTKLPVPSTLIQQAMEACRICYFFGVSLHQRHPPWSVTANICVPARNNPISFDRRFPKTGGGEDVDFCIRSQQHFGRCVAVPGARVLHPYWDRPLKQASGWADGDVICLETLPHSTFRATPNWAELVMLCLFLRRPDLALLAVLVEVLMSMPRFFESAAPLESFGRRLLVTLVAVLPSMLQDTRRLLSKIRRLRFMHLCLYFDWMNKTGNHATEKQLSILCRTVVFLIAAIALDFEGTARITALACLFLFCFICCINQADLRIIPQILKVPRPLNPNLDLGDTKVPFVIFGFQRTGSNLLCNLLGQHKQIAMHYEIFNDKAIYAHNGAKHTGDAIKDRDRSPADFLGEMYSVKERAKGLGGGQPDAVRFKVFPEHICRSSKSRELFEEILSDPRVRKIILYRRNRLAVCTSALRASVTGEYIKKNLDHVRVHIKPEGLQGFIDNYDDYYSYIRERLLGQGGAKGSWLQVSYEDLIEDHQGVTGKIFNFLGVSPFDPRSGESGQCQRQTNGDLSSAVDNFEELRYAFAGTDTKADFYEN